MAFMAWMGCDDPRRPPDHPPRPTRPQRPSALRGSPPVATVASPETPVDRPDAVTRCIVAAQRSTAPAVARALTVLGQESLFEDGCRLELAPAARDFSLCEAITEGPLRSACTARVAMVTGVPDRCPRAPGVCGRDPVCVAIAAREPGLCTAAMIHDRPRCEALARNDGARCNTLDPAFRAGCAGEVEALAGMLPAMPVQSLPEGRASLTLNPPSGDAGGAERSLRTVHRGVFLAPDGTLLLVDPLVGARVSPSLVDDIPQLAARIYAPRSHAPLRAEVRLAMPDQGGPEHALDWTPATATLDHTPRRRGDRVGGELIFDTTWHGLALHGTVRFESFVRDVMDPAALESPTN